MSESYATPLADMGGLKTSLMALFCDTPDLAKLIMPVLDNEAFTHAQNWYGGTYVREEMGKTTAVTLDGHCFDTPCIRDDTKPPACAIFMETYLIKVPNQHVKEVGIDIWVVCRKDFIRLSADEAAYYKAMDIQGNRIDCAIQLIDALLSSPNVADDIRKHYSIGGMYLSREGSPLKPYEPGNGFYGKCLSYSYQAYYQRKNMAK